jgi:hypothetical protein
MRRYRVGTARTRPGPSVCGIKHHKLRVSAEQLGIAPGLRDRVRPANSQRKNQKQRGGYE